MLRGNLEAPTASRVGRRDDGLLDPQAPKIGREARPGASTLGWGWEGTYPSASMRSTKAW